MRADVLVIGAGLAGLSAALECGAASVVLVNDTSPATDVASAWAQGGLAAALGQDDLPALHASDTLAAAAGLADDRVVRDLTGDAPAAIAVLERLGVAFDRQAGGALALGLEAAHSRRRIVHAADHTGATIVRRLLAVAASRPQITIRTALRAIDLLQTDDGRVVGALFVDGAGCVVRIDAKSVVLASGGYGGLFKKTTTPAATLGAGIALAVRAGATLADMEFVQFHPTALATGADPMPLVSEAVRGEGALLVNERAQRFVDELAARDVVARAIFALEADGGHAFLDARAAIGGGFARRFPTISAICGAVGIDPATERIPVTAAAHYTIGGIATDGRGRTGIAGLWACGEVAATGLHGANRLASNSLLEALVFGARAARDILATVGGRPAPRYLHAVPPAPSLVENLAATLEPLRVALSRDAGVIRDDQGLRSVLATCDSYEAAGSIADPRVRDAVLVARYVAGAALDRRESRGSHFRCDYPVADSRLAARAFIAPAQAIAKTS